jgi:aminobenzoyl-glutamate utilization protein B
MMLTITPPAASVVANLTPVAYPRRERRTLLEEAMESADSARLWQKMARLGLSRRQLLGYMGTAAAGTAAALQLDPVFAAITWERHPGADPGSYQPRRGLSAHSLAQEGALSWIVNNRQRVVEMSDRIWEYAELSMREWRSQIELANFLRDQGFQIRWGVAGMPLFFIATFQQGNGGPTIGFSGECDALPGLSQRAGSPVHDPIDFVDDPYRPSYGPGHGDAHNTLGSAGAAAAAAPADAMRRYNQAGTHRL